TTPLAFATSAKLPQDPQPGALGTEPPSTENKDEFWGGLTGTEVGEAIGAGGLGLVGTGRGGGGTGEGTIDLGTVSLIGKGGGGGSFGNARGKSKGKSSGVLGVLAKEQDSDAQSDLVGLGGLGLRGSGSAYDGLAEEKSGRKKTAQKSSDETTTNTGTGFGSYGYGSGTGHGSGYGRGTGHGLGRRPGPRIRQGQVIVQGALDREIIRRIIRSHINEIRYCYQRRLVQDPSLAGKVILNFVIDAEGKVADSKIKSSTLRDVQVGTCMARSARRWKFPDPLGGGIVRITYPFVFAPSEDAMQATAPPLTPEQIAERDAEAKRLQALQERQRIAAEAEAKRLAAARAEEQAELTRTSGSPYLGRSFDIAKLLTEGKLKEAMKIAINWRSENPGDVLALIAMGEAAEAAADLETAARAYGSLIDLFPSRADLRRYAGNRLDRLGKAGSELAIDTYKKAVEPRPDHPSSHRLYAFALTRAGRYSDAWGAILAGRSRSYPSGRFAGVDAIFDDDAGLIAAAWIRADPAETAKIRKLATTAGVTIPNAPSTHFVISWETDANDVDFHVHDGKGSHAYFGDRTLPSGGELYADVTTGYGPESFTIKGKATAYPYRLEAHYYSRGPMGYGMGKLQIIQHDGTGGLRFDERPFLIMKDGAFVPLGTVDKPL
ncbi:MAG TPA: AgmX/PglI C-terminal domain-containing protein, partial [Nannocystis exedens]|nr:AgmX/PglI C-terminal domain-containing protein [Nannocystis exedens]